MIELEEQLYDRLLTSLAALESNDEAIRNGAIDDLKAQSRQLNKARKPRLHITHSYHEDEPSVAERETDDLAFDPSTAKRESQGVRQRRLAPLPTAEPGYGEQRSSLAGPFSSAHLENCPAHLGGQCTCPTTR